jgi:pyruvate kinase
MVRHLRSPLDGAGHACRVAMDLAGPKLRTGPLQPGPRVLRVAPARDRLGRVTEPAAIWLGGHVGGQPGGTVVPVRDPTWLARRAVDDVIELTDARGARRRWRVTESTAAGCWVAVHETSYVLAGATLASGADGRDTVAVGTLPEVEQAHRVGLGDRVVLTRSLEPAVPTPMGAVHRIGCTLPEAFDSVLPGEAVWFDDGKIGGTVDTVSAEEIAVLITNVRAGGANLRAGKGINLPDTQLALAALTAKDLDDLPHVARLADVVNLSFVREPDDVAQLQSALHRVGADDVGVVLKIENATAFANLPELLLQAMRSPRVGVMIARGDLAVEIGFDRLAEVQEEIMWACEAAHVPVIWATQVLDTLARTGQPSRAEVTDAAMAQRTECVMLNKGPRITEAIAALDSILARMRHHQDKKRSLLRKLHAWDR